MDSVLPPQLAPKEGNIMNKNETSNNVLDLNAKLAAAKKPDYSQGDYSFDVQHPQTSAKPQHSSREAAPRTLKSDMEIVLAKGRMLTARAIGHDALRTTVAGLAVAAVAVGGVMLGAEGLRKLEDNVTDAQIKDRAIYTSNIINDAREHPESFTGVQPTDEIGINGLAKQLNPTDKAARERAEKVLTSEATTFNHSSPDNINTNLQEGTIYLLPAADVTSMTNLESGQFVQIVPDQLPQEFSSTQ